MQRIIPMAVLVWVVLTCSNLGAADAKTREPIIRMLVPGFNFNDFKTSNRVSLHPLLVSFNPFTNDGSKVGFNQDSTVGPGGSFTYVWYAGDRKVASTGALLKAPIEFGATNLISSDRIEHASKGAIGALIIEPANAVWTEGHCVLPLIGSAVCPRALADVSLETTPF